MSLRRGASGAIAVVAAIALIISGCGGSGDPEPLSTVQFVKQGNAICATMQAERSEQTKEAEQNLSDADEAETTSFALEPVEKMIDELGGLGPPKGQEK